MTNLEFQDKIKQNLSKTEIAQIAYDLIEDTLNENNQAVQLEKPELSINLPSQIKIWLDLGLNPCAIIDDDYCIANLRYGYTDYHIDALKLVLEKYNDLDEIEIEGEKYKYINLISSHVSYNYYNNAFLVKMFLLLIAYSADDFNLTFEDNLYQEMFDESLVYTSYNSNYTKIKLDKNIFKDIHEYDFMVEMLEQSLHAYGCWLIHIFHKKSKIKVATYGYSQIAAAECEP